MQQQIEPTPISKDRMKELRRERKAAPLGAPVSKLPPIPAANGATSAHWMAETEKNVDRMIYVEGGSSPGVYFFSEAYDSMTCLEIAAAADSITNYGRRELPTDEQMADLE